MLTDAQKERIVLAQTHGENENDFLLNNPIASADLHEYRTFWHDVTRVTRVKATPTTPAEEASFSNDIGFADGVQFIPAP